MLFKKKNYKNLVNMDIIKKTHHKNISFFYVSTCENKSLYESTFIYYNLFSSSNLNMVVNYQDSFIFSFSKKR
jgi:hypothetical protein